MRYIFVQGLGQSSSSWEKTISFLGDKEQFSHPDVFQLLNEEKKTYSNLYDAFSDYIEQFSEPVILIGLSLGTVLALNYATDLLKSSIPSINSTTIQNAKIIIENTKSYFPDYARSSFSETWLQQE